MLGLKVKKEKKTGKLASVLNNATLERSVFNLEDDTEGKWCLTVEVKMRETETLGGKLVVGTKRFKCGRHLPACSTRIYHDDQLGNAVL